MSTDKCKDYCSGTGMVLRNHYFVILGGMFMVYVIFTMSGTHDTFSANTLQASNMSSGIMKIAKYLKPEFVFTGTRDNVQVLLLTYMRSGSSLTGDILQHSPGAFYVYEPLHSLGNRNPSKFTIKFANGTLSSKITVVTAVPALSANVTSIDNVESFGPIPVLLLTYMRSGSSLTGDILQHARGAFYVYEPLHLIQQGVVHDFPLTHPNGRIRKPPFDFAEVAYDNLYNWFTCNVTNIPVLGLNDAFMRKGLKSRLFTLCMNDIHGKMVAKNAINLCARQLQAACENSPFRILKTIRLLLSDVRNLLEDLPNLKIIHLVRDPRATLYSQSLLGRCSQKEGGRNGCTSKFCKRVELDVLEEERLLKKYPGRIMPVFYQDIAKEPLKTTQKLYDFIGAKFTQEAQEYVYNITMAGNPDDCSICTTRSNSSEHIDTWKVKMDPTFQEIVNDRCNYIIQRYNFDNRPTT
ncbi:hypothetical protein ACF0H5_016137 [Mactra antiquata]